MVMRGGSSKGAYFVAADLPAETSARDDMLLRVMGSPDARQIDGIAGAHPLTSKVAIVGPCSDVRADVEYLFLQLGVDTDIVSDRQNCGNLLAGVGPFALERELITVDPSATEATVRILMLNTNTVATASFAVAAGAPVYNGDTAISGVPGTAAPISLEFEGLAGSSCGALFPTGNRIDVLDGVDCTLVDNGMPTVVLRASDMGITGTETPAELDADDLLRGKLESIRLQAGHLMNLGDVSDTTIPKMTMASMPNGDGNLATRTFIPHRCHEAIGVLGAVSVATAALVPGSAVDGVTVDPIGDTVRLEHPTGFFDAVIQTEAKDDGGVEVVRAGIVRTARKLMDGMAFPRSY